jgi:hypothetical protein
MSGVTKGMLAVRLFLIGVLAASLSAQIQFPGSGGRFPGSGGPGGTGGPIGGGGRRGKTGDSTPTKGRKDNAPVTITTTGILRLVAGNQFVIEADDHRIITYKAGDKMTVQKDGKAAELSTFATADHVTVDSISDDQGFFTAVAVTFNMPGTAREREEAARTWDLPNLGASSAKPAAASNREGDDDRPTLRRKNQDPPSQQEASASAEPVRGAPGAPEAEAADTRPTTLIRPNDPTPDADDPGRPQVRRGKPVPRASARNTEPEPVSAAPASTAAASSTAATASPKATASPRATAPAPRVADAPAEPAPGIIPVQEDPIIVKAKEAAAVYAGSLPNFFCRQLTTRYESDRPKEGWQALDTISADLAYEDGRESYKNIKVGNKAQKGSMEDVGGSWSTGEFASLLDDLFDPGTAATFRKSGQDTIGGRSATTFKFDVARERSHWRIMMAAQLYYPAFRGTVWIDRETSRVLRLEMETRNMPLLFPLAKVEEAVDYDFVRLAATQPFLLPTTSEVLSCQQGSSHCTRNRIEFRNYRKFGAESGITFDEKQ